MSTFPNDDIILYYCRVAGNCLRQCHSRAEKAKADAVAVTVLPTHLLVSCFHIAHIPNSESILPVIQVWNSINVSSSHSEA